MSAVYHVQPVAVRKSSASSSGMMSDHGHGDIVLSPTKKEPFVEGNLKIFHVIDCTENTTVMTVRFSPDGSCVAMGQSDGTIRISRSETGEALYALSDDDTKRRRLPVTSLRFVEGNDDRHELIATYASGFVKKWRYTSGGCRFSIEDKRNTLGCALNPFTSEFLTCGEDPAINIYSTDTGKKIRTLEPNDSRDVMNGHRSRVFSVQYHTKTPHLFVSGGWDDTVQFWDDRAKHSIGSLYGPHICGDAIDIEPLHNHLLTGSWRKHNVLQIYDYTKRDLVKDIPEDPSQRSMLYCAQWLGKENIVCGGCNHNLVRVIDRGTLNTVGQLGDLPAAVVAIDNDRQPKPRIAAASANRVYMLKMEKRQQ